jgi:cystathionine gamma-lyase
MSGPDTPAGPAGPDPSAGHAAAPAGGPNTRAIHAGVPEGEQGDPLLPGPVLAAPFHLRGDKDAAPYGYGRDGNPSWTHLERALGELDGGECTVFAAGMAAVTAVLFSVLRSGDVLVACGDGYPGIRGLARERLEPLGVQTRLVPTTEIARAAEGAALVWLETPSNPRLDVVDIATAADAAHAAGALLAVDNTVCTPLGQQPLAHGADFAMLSGTKSLCGHSDVLLGAVSVREAALADGLRRWRTLSGAIAGGFEAWLAHRSLATLGLRLERSSANAGALAALLRERDDVVEVCHPGESSQMAFTGPLVGFDLGTAERAQRFLGACALVAEATSFGGVHSTAERRGRWGTDDVSEGFIRFSAGCEDESDLLADVARALDASA